jgi:hypothetical protein
MRLQEAAVGGGGGPSFPQLAIAAVNAFLGDRIELALGGGRNLSYARGRASVHHTPRLQFGRRWSLTQ